MTARSKGYRLRDKDLIEVLEEAARQRCAMEIYLPDSDKTASSQVRDVLFHRDRIDIHAFNLDEIDRLVEPGAQAELTFRVREQMFVINTHCVEGARSISCHSFKIPKTINRIQRREHFRVSPPDAGSVTASIRYDPEGSFRGVGTIDISLGGGSFLEKRKGLTIEEGQGIDLHLTLRGLAEMALRCEVRHIRQPESAGSGLKLGIAFSDLKPDLEHKLNGALMEWQRQIQRDRAG